MGLVGFAIGAALAFSMVRMALHGAVKSSDPEARYFRGGMCRCSVRDWAAQFGRFQPIPSCERDAPGVDFGNDGGGRIARDQHECAGATRTPDVTMRAAVEIRSQRPTYG